MKISCIIPTYNRDDFLIEAVNSALGQSALPDEILIINNSSAQVNLSDDILQRVKVYNIIPLAGAAQARNFGAAMARGDYLAFLDDDDLWNKNYLKNVLDAIGSGAECVISRLDKIKDGKITSCKNINNKLNIDNLLTFNPGINGSNIVISKKLFFKVGGFDPKLTTGEDKSLLIEILKSGGQVKILPDNQAILRVHDKGNLSGAKTMAEGIFQFTRKYKKLMNKKVYIFNLLKICKHRMEAGEKFLIFQYLFLKAVYLVFKILFACGGVMPPSHCCHCERNEVERSNLGKMR